MGHARAYLTFDILRRIMSDYLHYDIEYHVNITDVDDKIILRARRNHLVTEFLKSNPSASDLIARSSGTLLAEKAKLEQKLVAAKEELANPSITGKRKTELEEQLKVQELKLSKVDGDLAALQGAQSVPREELIKLCWDSLGISLDAELGHTVCDNKIFDQHARKYEESFMVDMQRLGVRPPDVLTRVTEYVPKIVEYCDKLVKSGFAYVSNGSVYLDTKAFEQSNHTYRKLKPFSGETSKEELEESEGALGAGLDSEKKDPTRDFALWKKSKDNTGEPGWESPWGRGRPGWHIECSVVASDVLGARLDIHAGGEDLKFPHHDNELAQSEAYHNCQQWVNYFFHAGHLHIKGLKMSKSLKNFVSIEEALQISTPRRLRILFLIQPWDGSFTYSDQSLEEARSKEKRFSEFLGAIKAMDRDLIRTWLKREINEPSAAERKFVELLSAKKNEAHLAILNNFDTPGCITALGDIVDAFYAYKEEAKEAIAFPMCLEAGRYVSRMLNVFGVDFEGSDDAGASKEEIVTPFVEDIVGFREEIKAVAQHCDSETKVKILKACDRLRDETLVERGVSLQDEGGKTVWRLRDPKELKAEIAEVKQKIQQEAEAKRARTLKRAEEEIEGIEAVLKAGDGAGMFKTAEFTEWDANGVPTKDAKGEPVSKNALKKMTKEREGAQQKWDRLRASAEKEGFSSPAEYLEAKKAELEDLRSGNVATKKKPAAGGKATIATTGHHHHHASFTVRGHVYPTLIPRLKGKHFESVEEYLAFVGSA